ncbi:MAG: homoserine O-succinyltransferase [Desulfovibrio sp.]|nr:homoserine O-succinyltransferase [Desulfovibrio sp.]
MPIKIPAELPARKALESENIFVMTEDRASAQDIRPLEIAIVNLMPTKVATETQFLRLLGNSPIQVNATLLRTAEHESRNAPEGHLERFYSTFAEARERNFDGLIVTGAPVEHLPFDEVDYWDELAEIMEYAQKKVYSTLYICWAAQAALNYFYNISKRSLPRKISGVFPHTATKPNLELFRGFDDVFYAPHSRHTEILEDDIRKIPGLEILATSPDAGVAILENREYRQVFMTGHFEYDRDTLAKEYERDVLKGLNPDIPRNYFPGDDPGLIPTMSWKAHAHLFFSNWLNYYVYQNSPFSIGAIQPNEVPDALQNSRELTADSVRGNVK